MQRRGVGAAEDSVIGVDAELPENRPGLAGGDGDAFGPRGRLRRAAVGRRAGDDQLVEVERRIHQGVERGEGLPLFTRQFVAKSLVGGLSVGSELAEPRVQVVADLRQRLLE